jgi:hypothetical protein
MCVRSCRASCICHSCLSCVAGAENPIFFHATAVDTAGFKNAIQQMSEVGFEMFIYSFGTPFTLETNDSSYLALVKASVDLAKQYNIEVRTRLRCTM